MSQRIITTDITSLIENASFSSLSASAASGGSTITIYSITNFAVDKVLIIGEPGAKGTEIIKTHASTAPTGSTVTLASNLVKAHAKDTRVYIINYDQLEISHADTITGSKDVLQAATDIDPEAAENTYRDTAESAGYYFSRFKNSIDSTFSAYSDPIPYGGLGADTLGYAAETALDELGYELGTDVPFDAIIRWTNQMLRLVRGKQKRWSNYQEMDYNVGTVSMGVRSFDVPDTIYYKNNNQSMLNLRIGNSYPLIEMTRSEYLQMTEDVSYTEVATQAEIADTSLVLDDTSDLDDTGSITVYVSGTKYTIEYTANTKSTNTLTVAADQITAQLAVDTPVWQNITEETPKYFGIWDGKIYLWPMIDSSLEGQNLTGDFYTDIVSVDSEADVIESPRYDMLIHFLKWKIKAKMENGGREELNDPSYAQFREILQDAIENDNSGEIRAFTPRRQSVYGGRAQRRR